MEHVMTWRGAGLGSPTGWARRALLAILAFEAAGALIGGPLLVAAPNGRLMQIPIGDLHGTFADFLIPGVLLSGLGILNAIAFIALWRQKVSAWLWVGLALGGFLIWFVVELAITGFQNWAQAAWGLPVPVGIILALPMESARLHTRGAP
jgi:hypothetical protein